MGNEQSSKYSKYANLNTKQFLASYTYVKKVNDPRYGEMSVYQKTGGSEKVALIEKTVNSSKVLAKDLKDLHQRRQLSHPYLMKFYGIASEEHNKFCSTNHRIVAIVEYIDRDLEADIKQRRSSSTLYTESEIWAILSQTLSVLAYLHSYKIVHGDIRCGNIFVGGEDTYKLVDQSLLAQGNSSYIQMLANINANICTLSPELVTNLKTKELLPQHNPYKSDCFSLGMSVLNAILLKRLDTCYDWQNCQFNNDSLIKQLEEIKNVYSIQLYEFMSNMLTVEIEKRPDAVYMNHQVRGIVGESTASLLLMGSPHSSYQVESARSHSPISRSQQQQDEEQDQSQNNIYFSNQVSVTSYHQNNNNNNNNNIQQSDNQVPNYFSNPLPTKQKVFIPPKKDEEERDKSQTKSHKVKAKKKNKDDQIKQQTNNNEETNNSVIGNNQIDTNNKKQEIKNSLLDNIGVVQSVIVNEEQLIPLIRQMPQISPEKFMSQGDDQQCVWKPVYIETNGKIELKKLPIFIPQNIDPSLASLQNYYPEIKFEYPQLNKQSNEQQQQQDISEQENKKKQKSKRESRTIDNEKNDNSKKERDATPDFNKNDNTQNLQSSDEILNIQRGNAFSFGNQQNTVKPKDKNENIKENEKIKEKEKIKVNEKNEKNKSDEEQEVQVEPKKNQPSPYTQQQQQFQPQTLVPGQQPSHGFYVQNQQQMGMLGQPYQPYGFNPYQPRGPLSPNYTQFPGQQPFNPYQQQPHQVFPGQQGHMQYPPQHQLHQQQQQLLQQQQQQTQKQQQSTQQQQLKQSSQQVQQTQAYATQNTQQQQQQQVPQSSQPYVLKNQQQQVPLITQSYGTNADQLTLQFQQLQFQQQQHQLQQLKQQQIQQGYTLQQQQQYPPLKKADVNVVQSGNVNLSPAQGMSREEELEFVKERYSDNSLYEGQKCDGLRHGKGKFYHRDGSIYDGEWKGGLMDGRGKFYFPGNKLAYEGQFKNDEFNGKGVLYNENPVLLQGMIDYSNLDSIGDYWIKYEGDFAGGIKQGQGVLYLSNNEIYSGSFQDDNISGKGTFQRANKQVVKGQWINNQLTLVYES